MGIKLVKDATGGVELSSTDDAKIDREIDYIKQNSDMSNQELADELDISIWSVQRRRRTLRVRSAEAEEEREELLTQLAELLSQRENTREKLDRVDEEIDQIAKDLVK